MAKFLNIRLDTKKDFFIFRMDNTNNFYRLLKTVVTDTTLKIIFKLSKTKIEIHDYFLFDFYNIIERIYEYENDEKVKLAIKHFGIVNLNIIKHLLENETYLKDLLNQETKIPNITKLEKILKFKPLPHQLRLYSHYLTSKSDLNIRGVLLDAAVGTGKTYMSLSLGELLNYKRFLVIAPKAVLDRVWVKSITNELYKKPQSYKILTTKDFTFNNEKFLITNYETIIKLVNDDKFKNEIKKIKPFLIVDESHNLNNIDAKRTASVIDLVNFTGIEDIALLTGTPIKMTAKELTAVSAMLDKRVNKILKLVELYFKSADLHVIKKKLDYYRVTIHRDTDRLPGIFMDTIRIELKDYKKYLLTTIREDMKQYKEEKTEYYLKYYDEFYLDFLKLLNLALDRAVNKGIVTDKKRIMNRYLDLVKTFFKHREFILPLADQLKEAKEIEEKYILPMLVKEEKDEFKRLAAIVKYPNLKAMGEALGNIVLKRRLECYTKLAKNLDYKDIINSVEKKTIVFSTFINTCEKAYEESIKQELKPIRVYGEYVKDLAKNVKWFNDIKSKVNPLIATYQSLSTGVPLIGANQILMLNVPFRLYMYDQSIGRAWRLSQDTDVYIINVKLYTEEDYNITDRDLYILNLSKNNVEFITGSNTPYDIPEGDEPVQMDDTIPLSNFIDIDGLISTRTTKFIDVIKNTIIDMFNSFIKIKK